MNWFRFAIMILLAAGGGLALWWPNNASVLGSYCTSLAGRSKGQRMNATRAARALDGSVLEAGHEFSFNRAVGPWTPDRGYVLAPVSYDGELIADWGGGVCQTSTTLYNAALIAGLEIVERHRHNWAPGYVPPGRDAAVAQFTTDLRLRNPYTTPIRIRAVLAGESIGFEILGRRKGAIARIESVTDAAVQPTQIVQQDARLTRGQRRLITKGRPGVSVAVFRIFSNGQRECVSRDTYPPMDRVIAVGQ